MRLLARDTTTRGRRVQIRSRLRIFTAIAALSAGIGVISAPPAAAASPCWTDGSAPRGYYWCYNVAGAPVYKGVYTYEIVGYMNTTKSWFACRYDYGGWVGGPHPYRWLLTKADNGAWGYMKDSDIYSETDPVTEPTYPNSCSWSGIP